MEPRPQPQSQEAGVGPPLAPPRRVLRSPSPYAAALDHHARSLLREAIAASRGQPDAAAARLGLSRGSLYRELRRLRLTAELEQERARATVASGTEASHSA